MYHECNGRSRCVKTRFMLWWWITCVMVDPAVDVFHQLNSWQWCCPSLPAGPLLSGVHRDWPVFVGYSIVCCLWFTPMVTIIFVLLWLRWLLLRLCLFLWLFLLLLVFKMYIIVHLYYFVLIFYDIHIWCEDVWFWDSDRPLLSTTMLVRTRVVLIIAHDHHYN